MILVVVGLSIVAVTFVVVAEPDKPAMERFRTRRAGRPARPLVAAVAPPAPASSLRPPRAVGSGELYRPPRWWQRLRSIVLLVILTTAVGATVAAVVGALLALIGLGVREAVS